MQLDFLLAPFRKVAPDSEVLRIGSETVPIRYIRNPKARRYIIRLQPDGSVRATVPRVGSFKQARAFVEGNRDWIVRQLRKRQEQPAHPTAWQHGTEVLYRGETVALHVATTGNEQTISFADQVLRVSTSANVRVAIEHHLRRLAVPEITARALELAASHGLTVRRVTVRSQRSRWGSCSRRGTISLNCRLIQAPVYVRDYIILHELAHLREHNHSKQFWAVVAEFCPDYQKAESWLKGHRGLLRSALS
jgi:predicted metal-dependent hydrolase